MGTGSYSAGTPIVCSHVSTNCGHRKLRTPRPGETVSIYGNLETPRAERASVAGNRSRDRSDQRAGVPTSFACGVAGAVANAGGRTAQHRPSLRVPQRWQVKQPVISVALRTWYLFISSFPS